MAIIKNKRLLLLRDELISEIEKKSYPESAYTQELLKRPFDHDQVVQALEIYGAFRRPVERYQLAGVSVRCFDLPTLISMSILGTVSGQHAFQCNPSRVDRAAKEIVFAHCTLPLDMPEKYHLDTHFESKIGVAIAGDIPLGKVTIFKASADLSHYFVASGEIVEDLHEDDLCRTQIRVHCDVPVEQFRNSHVGNHYLVCRGDYADAVRACFGF